MTNLINIFLHSKFLSILLVLISYLAYLSFKNPREDEFCHRANLVAIGFYSVIGWLPISNPIKLNLSIVALGVLLATGFYLNLKPMIDEAIKQKARALKKVPFLVVIVFYTLSNSVDASWSYLMIGIGLILLHRNIKVAFFTWPFLLAGFLEKSAIIEVLVISSQFLGIYLLKDRNEDKIS
ncbi:hypothetical protein A9Q84_05850 [Halobacteriovorax marinus]|uniref:Uncharacterized protein n=1 Tax=Halobacteriovorax marinus TaxID=97084 RepID=A0A1Y5FFD5_9BACT|nr:hypothetical protein A9Q84_05850 [Halobacteriovorax marinus]